LNEIFVRYGELGLKSPPVRRRMEKRLAINIKILLEKIGLTNIDITINRSWARLIISLEGFTSKEDITQKIISVVANNVAGITSLSPVTRISSDMEEIKKTALTLAKKNMQPGSSFAVRARRIGNHNYTSQDLERLVGEVLFESLAKKLNLTVNLTKPDYTLSIEVKDEVAFIFDEKISGIGGLPQGTHGTIYSILRGSVEDAIAGFLLSKRGANVIPIAFTLKNTKEFSNSSALDKQLEIFNFMQPKKQFSYFEVDFTKIIDEIKLERLQCTTCDQLCIKITEQILENKTIDGITLGNSPEAILDRIPESSKKQLKPIYYPMISLKSQQIENPFQKNFKSEFCLNKCPGFENQKKKEIKPPSTAEFEQIVANANFSLIKPDKS